MSFHGGVIGIITSIILKLEMGENPRGTPPQELNTGIGVTVASTVWNRMALVQLQHP